MYATISRTNLVIWLSIQRCCPSNIRGNSSSSSIARTRKEEYTRCFGILGLKENCTQDELRDSFLLLAKRHHPDSNTQEADAEKFQMVNHAYRILQEKFELEKQELATKSSLTKGAGEEISSEIVESDIDHTAPQHRQYLNFGGIGHGSPFQRQKQYQQHQVKKAIENVYSHRISQIANPDEQALVYKDAKASKKTKTKYGIDRLVEDLIQESMSKGEFSNLKGAGKPLQYQNHNPYIDVVTHKINQVLIDNGFSPQWVMLEKEIRAAITDIKNQLKEKRAQIGPLPLSPSDSRAWDRHLASLSDDVKSINKKINDYNLVVPLLHKQLVHVNLERLADKCLKEEPSRSSAAANHTVYHPASSSAHEPGFLGTLFGTFWKQN